MNTVEWWLRPESSLVIDSPQSDASLEAACAAYREALKNVMRSKPKDRKRIANEALFGKGVEQRGKTMLKVFKAAVQVWWFSRKGSDKDFVAALQCLEVAMANCELKGPSARKWLRKKELAHA